jgi:hypothetical protein
VLWNVSRGGTYAARLWAVDSAGNGASLTVFEAVRVGEYPVARPGSDRTVPAGSIVRLDGRNSTDDFGIVSYRWSFRYQGIQQNLLGDAVDFAFDVPGTYAVTLIVEDAAGREHFRTINVQVLGEDGGTTGEEFPLWIPLAFILVGVIVAFVLHFFLLRREDRVRKRRDDLKY